VGSGVTPWRWCAEAEVCRGGELVAGEKCSSSGWCSRGTGETLDVVRHTGGPLEVENSKWRGGRSGGHLTCGPKQDGENGGPVNEWGGSWLGLCRGRVIPVYGEGGR